MLSNALSRISSVKIKKYVYSVMTAIVLFTMPITAQPITNWDHVQGAIDNAVSGAVIDLSSLSSPTSPRTFTVHNSKTLTIRGTASRQLGAGFTFGSNNNITIENLNISSNSGVGALHFTGTGNTLNLVGTNTIVSTYAAVGVPIGAGLTITSSTNGVFNATSSYYGAGIGGSNSGAGGSNSGAGGSNSGAGGTITISGGTITANGGRYTNGSSAGIGGTITANGVGASAGIGGSNGGGGGTITISGGTITANGGGAGIGGGNGGGGGTITISGGTITANGGGDGAGIGGGDYGAGGMITISGGMITANGNRYAAGIGGGYGSAGGTITINGGSVRARAGTVTSGTAAMDIGNGGGPTGGTFTLRNSAGQNVFLNTLTVPNQTNASLTAGSINNVSFANTPNAASGVYGIRDVRTDAQRNLYFYLPASANAQVIDAVMGGVQYYATAPYIRESNHVNAQTMIAGGNISSATVSVGTAIYTGSALMPDITVVFRGATLRPNTDYTVSWSGERISTSSTDAMVTVTGTGVYTGTVEQSFTITPKPLTTAMLSIPAVTFDNTEHTPVLTVTDIDIDLDEELVIDVDYTVTLEPQTDAGAYAVTVTGIGNYTGTPSVDFVINPLALTEAEVVVSGTYTFNGAEHIPNVDDVVVTLDGYTPTYNFVASDNINAGIATVTVTGTGNFGGTATGTFTIAPKELADGMLSIPSVTFNGNPQTPALTAVDGTMTLVEDTDYTVTFESQTDVGTYPVTVTGIGNYTGSASVNFVINTRALTNASVAAGGTYIYNGQAHTPVGADVSVTLAGYTPTYDIGATNNINAGTATVTVTGTGNFSGTATGTFTILPRPLTDATVIVGGTYTYNGLAHTPVDSDVSVTLAGYTPTYDIGATNNINAGTATVTVTGTGNFSGTATGTFTILPRPLTDATVIVGGAYTYNGLAHTPVDSDVSVTLAGYTPTYSRTGVTNNTNAGSATLTVTGTGNFGGTATGTFTILPKALTDGMLSIPAVVFNGSERTPVLTVTDHNIGGLTIGVDYNATLTPHTNAGSNAVSVTGAGNYSGTASVNFVINPKPLTAEMLSISSVVFNDAAQTPVLAVTDGDIGLARNVDYTVTLTPQTAVGTYPVTVTGMGNYTGTPYVNFVITNREVSVLSPDRIIPIFKPNEETSTNASVNVLTAEFTAGPNPVNRQSGEINFFWRSKRIQDAMLTIFDASGNVVSKIKIKDTKDANDNNARRIVGSWDLKDAKGRLVSEGTYLVRGVVTTSDGKRERISVMVGVR